MRDRSPGVAVPPPSVDTPLELEVAKTRQWRWIAVALLGVGAVIFPFILDDYIVRVATTVIMLGVMAASWNLIGGYAGYPSFGNAAFFGFGAYGAAVPMVRLGLPFPIGLALGGLASAALAVLVGIPVLRLRGHYFAIATLGVLGVTQQIVILADRVTGGGEGLTLPLSGLSLETFNEMIYLVMLAILAAVVSFTVWMSRNRLGYGLVAIRENEVAARVMGVNTTLYKVIAFAASGFFTGLAGATYAYWLSSLDPSVAFDYTYNVLLVVMAFFGGAGTVLGPLIGALVLGVISEWLRGVLVQYHLLVFGIVIVLTVIFAPRGVLDLIGRRRQLSLSSVLENIREHSV
jgi:branched-chain amino acid transport system permease protein